MTVSSHKVPGSVWICGHILPEKPEVLAALKLALNPDRLLTSSEVNSTVDWSVSSHTVPGRVEPESSAVNQINKSGRFIDKDSRGRLPAVKYVDK